MNLGYMNRRIVSMNYKLRIVSLAWASTNLFEKPRKGFRLYMINAKNYCSEVKIGKQISPTSASGSNFSMRMRRVPHVSKPFQTAINLMYWKRSKERDGLTRVRLSKSVRQARAWKKRLKRPDAYLNRYDLNYLNSVKTTSRLLDSKNKLKNTSYISKKV